MKLTREATTAANPDLRGRKHHFIIESATAAELEAMDEILTLAGWENDTCPCYEDGFGCGYWIDISEVACFKAAYKAAKTGLKGYMAVEAEKAAAVCEVTAEPAPQHIPAASLDDYTVYTLHEPIEAEEGKPYAEKRVTRAYVARSMTRALASQEKHVEKYKAQDVIWLAEHNADHAFRMGVLSPEEFTEIYHMIRAENAQPLLILAALRDALLTGAPALAAARAA